MAVHSAKDYLLLQLVNGTIKFTVDNGRGPITVKYTPAMPQDVCDGNWIKIEGKMIEYYCMLFCVLELSCISTTKDLAICLPFL